MAIPTTIISRRKKGTGRIEVRGKQYTLGANEGILIAPSVPHSYHRESTSWITMFATFTGTLAGSIPSMTDNQEVILTPKEQGLNIRKLISYSFENTTSRHRI